MNVKLDNIVVLPCGTIARKHFIGGGTLDKDSEEGLMEQVQKGRDSILRKYQDMKFTTSNAYQILEYASNMIGKQSS